MLAWLIIFVHEMISFVFVLKREVLREEKITISYNWSSVHIIMWTTVKTCHPHVNLKGHDVDCYLWRVGGNACQVD